MKKTLTVNLGGMVFNIDEDAYRLLDSYLNNLKLHFRTENGAEEIMDDIERRISELFADRQTNGIQVISIAHVEEVIALMGNPEEIDNEPGEEGTDTGGGQPHTEARMLKRLFRNPDDRILGGVLGGFSVYLGWEPVWVRLAFFLITLLGYQILIPLYIICWIVMPEARTAAEKLSMRGEAATVENIGRTVTDGFSHRESAQPAMDMPWWKKAGNVLLNILGGLVKAALVVLAVVCVPVLFAFCLALIPLLFAVVVIMISGAGTLVSLFPVIGEWIPSSPLVAMLMVLCVILVVGIPLFAILWMVFRTVLHWHPMPLGVKWTLLILWLISVVAGVSNLLFFVAEPLSIHDLMSA